MKKSALLFAWLWFAGCGGSSSSDLWDNGKVGVPGDAANDGGPPSDAPTVDVGAEVGDPPDGSGSSAGGSSGSSGSTGGSGGGSGGAGGSGGSAGSSAGPCDGGPYVTHDNGLGQTWRDCSPLGTATQSEATAACNVHCAANDAGSCQVGELSSYCSSVPGVMAMSCVATHTAWLWSESRPVMQRRLDDGTFTCMVVGTWQ